MSDRCSTLSALRGKHTGEHLYILGSGPQLNELTAGQRSLLEARTTLGVNRTHHFLASTYLISSHPETLAGHSAKTVALHARWNGETTPLAHGALPVPRSRFVESCGFSRNDSVLLSDRNVIFLATHLAYILGAAAVSYVGVEMNDDRHFSVFAPPQRSFSEFPHEATLRLYRERMEMPLYATKEDSLPFRAGCALDLEFANA